jgi:hypothetical protein
MITVLDFFAYRVIVAELLFYRRKKSPDSLARAWAFSTVINTACGVLIPNPYIVYSDCRSIKHNKACIAW